MPAKSKLQKSFKFIRIAILFNIHNRFTTILHDYSEHFFLFRSGISAPSPESLIKVTVLVGGYGSSFWGYLVSSFLDTASRRVGKITNSLVSLRETALITSRIILELSSAMSRIDSYPYKHFRSATLLTFYIVGFATFRRAYIDLENGHFLLCSDFPTFKRFSCDYNDK